LAASLASPFGDRADLSSVVARISGGSQEESLFSRIVARWKTRREWDCCPRFRVKHCDKVQVIRFVEQILAIEYSRIPVKSADNYPPALQRGLAAPAGSRMSLHGRERERERETERRRRVSEQGRPRGSQLNRSRKMQN